MYTVRRSRWEGGGVGWGVGVLILSSIFMIEKHDACYLSICLQQFLSPDRKLFITVKVYFQLEEYFLAKTGETIAIVFQCFCISKSAC